MSAQETATKAQRFEIDGSARFFRTVTTYENNKISNTSYQEKIDKDVYEQRLKTTPDLVKKGSDGSYYVVVSNRSKISEDEYEFKDTIYADLNFQKKFKKRGKNSLIHALDASEDDAIKNDRNNRFNL